MPLKVFALGFCVFCSVAGYSAECPNVIITETKVFCLPSGLEDSDTLPKEVPQPELPLFDKDAQHGLVLPSESAFDLDFTPDKVPQ